MDFAPFKQWYLQHYGIDIGRKKKPVVAKKETNEVLHYGIDCLAELVKKTNGQCFPEDEALTRYKHITSRDLGTTVDSKLTEIAATKSNHEYERGNVNYLVNGFLRMSLPIALDNFG
nr:40S ribosomal protein S8 [Ipomoea batatas]